MKWYKGNRCRNISLNEITISKRGIYFNNELVNNLNLSSYNFAQVAYIDKTHVAIQFTSRRIDDASNFKVCIIKSGAIRINAVKFVKNYFDTSNLKHGFIDITERDNDHILLTCNLEEIYKK